MSLNNDLNKEEGLRVIFILSFSPKYELARKGLAEPLHQWLNQKGEMIGIWSQDHAHYLGFNLLKYYPSMTFEVWRPDYRAEKVYEHTFSNGLIHRSFPSVKKSFQQGLFRKKGEYAPAMESYLDQIVSKSNQSALLMVPATGSVFSTRLFKKYHGMIPMLGYHFVSNNALIKNFPSTLNPFRWIHFKMIDYQYRKHFQHIKNLSVPHWNRMEELALEYGCQVWFNQFGMHYDFWQPDIPKGEARRELNLGPEKILLFSSRLVPEYQIDKVLDIISMFKDKPFLCIFTSFGPQEYQRLITQKIKDLKIEDHVLFTGWVDNEKFKKYYAASDVFCSTGIAQAGPGSTFYAMLMEKPVVTTDAGLAAELLRKYQCGLFLPPTDYSKWEEAFKSVIENDTINIKIIDRQIVADFVDWNTRAEGWINTFTSIVEKFNKNNN